MACQHSIVGDHGSLDDFGLLLHDLRCREVLVDPCRAIDLFPEFP
jgi:hypothetical protein